MERRAFRIFSKTKPAAIHIRALFRRKAITPPPHRSQRPPSLPLCPPLSASVHGTGAGGQERIWNQELKTRKQGKHVYTALAFASTLGRRATLSWRPTHRPHGVRAKENTPAGWRPPYPPAPPPARPPAPTRLPARAKAWKRDTDGN